MKSRKFGDHLHEMLQDSEFAVVYVQATLEASGVEEFLYALREVAMAQSGVRKVAEESQRGRESLYKSLSKQGNPRIRTLDDIPHALGMRLAVTRDTAAPKARQEQTHSAPVGQGERV